MDVPDAEEINEIQNDESLIFMLEQSEFLNN